MKLIVLVAAAALIALISWWFFGKHEQSAATAEVSADGSQTVDVLVEGGYKPETVVLKQGVPAVLNFMRKDASGCLEQVVFPDLGLDQFLPQGEAVAVPVDTSKPGEYTFACGMNMFHGKVVVK